MMRLPAKTQPTRVEFRKVLMAIPLLFLAGICTGIGIMLLIMR